MECAVFAASSDSEDATTEIVEDGNKVTVPHGMHSTLTVNISGEDGICYSESEDLKMQSIQDEELELVTEEDRGDPAEVLHFHISKSEFGIHQKQNAGKSDVQRKKRNFTEDGPSQPSKMVKRSEQPQKKQMPHTSTECGESDSDLPRCQWSENIQVKRLEENYAAEEHINCMQSTKSFSPPQEVHTGEKYKCTECNIICNNPTHLNQHHLANHVEKPYKCPECKKQFVTVHSMSQHRRMRHNVEQAFQCSACNTAFNSLPLLNKHRKECHALEQFKCPECKRGFSSSDSLLEHQIVIHNVERPFVCTDCNLKFLSSFPLNKHQSLVHSAKGSFKCPECNKYFSNSDGFRDHQIAMHNAEKPFQCTECNLKFMTESRLNKHLPTHLRKTYKCPKCNSIFSSSLLVDFHLHTAHGSKDSFKCPDCNEHFCEVDRMTRHRLIIHNFQEHLPCAHCTIMFISLEQLMKHQASCKAGGPYPCPECTRWLKNIPRLRSHLLKFHKVETHSSVTDLHESICSSCSAGFSMAGEGIMLHNRQDENCIRRSRVGRSPKSDFYIYKYKK